jgi:hypothetical protein
VTEETEQITVQLDRLSLAALEVLRSDGTGTSDAVCAAIIAAAEHHPEPSRCDVRPLVMDLLYADRLDVLAADAPP